MPHPQKLNRRLPSTGLPAVTLLVTGGALLVALFHGWSARLVYDRQAILAGECWRLFTGHWVHFSASHLFYDTLALGLIGWMIEARRLPGFGWLCLLAPWSIGTVLLLFCPDLNYYGGLSGLAACALVYLALAGWEDGTAVRGWRGICLLALLGMAGKILYELHTGRMLLATINSGSVAVSTASHVAGALTALGFFGARKLLFWFRQRGADGDAQNIGHGAFPGIRGGVEHL